MKNLRDSIKEIIVSNYFPEERDLGEGISTDQIIKLLQGRVGECLPKNKEMHCAMNKGCINNNCSVCRGIWEYNFCISETKTNLNELFK